MGQEDQAEGIKKMKGVIINHLDKFACREVPLGYQWEDGES